MNDALEKLFRRISRLRKFIPTQSGGQPEGNVLQAAVVKTIAPKIPQRSIRFLATQLFEQLDLETTGLRFVGAFCNHSLSQ